MCRVLARVKALCKKIIVKFVRQMRECGWSNGRKSDAEKSQSSQGHSLRALLFPAPLRSNSSLPMPLLNFWEKNQLAAHRQPTSPHQNHACDMAAIQATGSLDASAILNQNQVNFSEVMVLIVAEAFRSQKPLCRSFVILTKAETLLKLTSQVC